SLVRGSRRVAARSIFFRLYLRLICAAVGRKASVHADIATLRPSTLFKPSPESREARRHFRIVLDQGRQHGDPANSFGLLCERSERPRCRRAAEQRDEVAPFHARHGSLPPPCGGSPAPSA